MTKSVVQYRRRRESINQIKEQLRSIDDYQVTELDETFDLLKNYLLKRHKQRFEKLGIVRYILRILMLFKRITGSNYIMDQIVFALMGFFENLLGIVKLFNNKNQMIKLSYYTEAKKKYMARKQ